MSARSAYRLRSRKEGVLFAEAWDRAIAVASHRLVSLAPSTACQGRRSGQAPRAINGTVEEIYKDGQLVAERHVPSDKLLMFLLRHVDRGRFGAPKQLRWEMRGFFAKQLGRLSRRLADIDEPTCRPGDWPSTPHCSSAQLDS